MSLEPPAVPAPPVPSPDWADPRLPPDQFLYGRAGPWPQPSPSHPGQQAPQVLNIPPLEQMVWNEQIGVRYLKLGLGYPPLAAYKATIVYNGEPPFFTEPMPLPSDDQFNWLMGKTCFQRYRQPIPPDDLERIGPGAAWGYKYDFSAMRLIKPMQGVFCAPVVCYFQGDGSCGLIQFRATEGYPEVLVKPGQAAWNLAKVFALQGASYHMLFVVHPVLHFPMDSVNAITKTCIPHIHPLFQVLYPHTAYTLPLDNAVLQSPDSVIGPDAQGTWFDPLTDGAYDLKNLFGAGYAGLDHDPWYKGAYPAYDYLKPWKDTGTSYGTCLAAYYELAFLPFAKELTKVILSRDPKDPYVTAWMNHNAAFIRGFPACKPGEDIDPSTLARVLAIFLWDVTVAHAADHYSFAYQIGAHVTDPQDPTRKLVSAAYKFLRIRVDRPRSADQGDSYTLVNQVCNADDLYRAEMANEIFFRPVALKPNLDETYYATTDLELGKAQFVLHKQLLPAAQEAALKQDPAFIRLTPKDATPEAYEQTISASIQY